MHTITFSATKGGTGRTIATMALASGFLALGKRVSVMDCTDLVGSNPKGRCPSPLQSWMQKMAANKFQPLQLELIECWTREQVEDSLAVAEARGVDVVLVDTNARLAKPLLTALRLTYLIIATTNGPFVAKYTMKNISYYLSTPEHLMGLVAGCRAGAPEACETRAVFNFHPVFQSEQPWIEALSDQILNGDIALFASMLACKPEKLGYTRFCDTQTAWIAVQRLTFEVQWALNDQRHDLRRRSIPLCLQEKGRRMIKRFSLPALCIFALTAPAAAEDVLVAMPAPAERPYPYEILGLQPGDPLDDVLAVYAERSDAAPTSESEVLRVQSPDGAVFEFSYQLFTRIGDVGINGRLAKAAQDQVTATLSSDVMEQRPMAIHRSIRQPSDELPEPLALKAQIEETYGPPSRVEVNGREMTLTYAWSTEGFIANLDAIGPITHEEERTFSGRTSTSITEYELCGSARHYLNNVEYRFEYPRDKLIKPGCLATFTVSYRGDPGMTSINFSLVDYELGRQHMAELDRQIVEALTGKTVEASDMDL